jgi:hypothetical protein
MAKKKQETQPTRPDLKDDQEWLIWLRLQPENRGIDVDGLYRKMLAWCERKGAIPTRMRLVRWLATERENVPMTYEPAYFKGDESVSSPHVSKGSAAQPLDPNQELPPCPICGQKYCLKDHRNERGL